MKEIIIKAEEYSQLVAYLDQIPHKYGKDIEAFFNTIAIKRAQEAQAKVEVPAESATPVSE